MPSKPICQHIPINTYHCNNYQTTPTSPHLPGNTCLSQCQHLPVHTPACSHIYLFMTSCQHLPVHTPTCPCIHLLMTSCQHPSCTNMSMYLPVHDILSTSTCSHTNLSMYPPAHDFLSTSFMHQHVHVSTCSGHPVNILHAPTCPCIYLFRTSCQHPSCTNMSMYLPVQDFLSTSFMHQPVHVSTCSGLPVNILHAPTCPCIYLFMTSCQHPSCTNMSMYPPVHDFLSTSFTHQHVHVSTCSGHPVNIYLFTHQPVHVSTCSWLPVNILHAPTCPCIYLFRTSCQHPSCTNMSIYLPVQDFRSTSTCSHTNLSIYLPVHTYLSVCELAGRDWSSTSLWAVFTCRMSVTSRVYLRWQWPHDHTSCESSECT